MLIVDCYLLHEVYIRDRWPFPDAASMPTDIYAKTSAHYGESDARSKTILLIRRGITFMMLTGCLIMTCIVANLDLVIVIRCKPPAEHKKEIANLKGGDEKF